MAGFALRFGVIAAMVAVLAAASTYGLFWEAPAASIAAEAAAEPDSLATPARVTPPFTARPVFTLLRAAGGDIEAPFGSDMVIDGKLVGVALTVAAFLVPFVLSLFRWARIKPLAWAAFVFAAALAWVALGAISLISALEGEALAAGRVAAAAYFALFLVVFPALAVLTRRDEPAAG